MIDCTTLQVIHTTKPLEVSTNASGSAKEAVLGQEHQAINFLNQVMIFAGQKHSIHNKEHLALVTAL